MKSIILYESKHGCTKTCASYIKEKKHIDEITKVSDFNGDLKDYDRIIIGTPVYIGQINKKIKNLINDHKALLLKKELDIFICGMNEEGYEEMLIMNFDEDIRNHAKITHAGGAYDFDKLGWLSKLIVKKIAKVDHSVEHIKYEHMDLI